MCRQGFEDLIDAADRDMSAKEALQDFARAQRAPFYRAGVTVTVTKTCSSNEQNQRLLAAIGTPIPKRHTGL